MYLIRYVYNKVFDRKSTHLLMIIVQNFLTLFDLVSSHLEQFQVYERLAKETGTNETRQRF